MYGQLRKLGTLTLKAGHETAELRKAFGLVKGQDKMSLSFNAGKEKFTNVVNLSEAYRLSFPKSNGAPNGSKRRRLYKNKEKFVTVTNLSEAYRISFPWRTARLKA
jgi:hypothetical protein